MSQPLTAVLLPLHFLKEENILQLKASLSSNQGCFFWGEGGVFVFERDINESIVSETNFNEPDSQRAQQGAALALQ